MEITKNMVNKEVKKKFHLLSEDDFFECIDNGIIIDETYFYKNNEIIKNDNLLSSCNVLMYCLKNSYSFKTISEFFDEAFNDDIIKAISELNYDITEEQYLSKQILFRNKKILTKALNSYPDIINHINQEYINDELLNIINNSQKLFNINEELLYSYSILRNNPIIMKSAIKNNPRLVLLVSDINEELINYSLECGFIPSIKDLEENRSLINYSQVLEVAFEKDPSVIKYMVEPQLNYNTAQSAVDRGYIVTLRDIKNNSELGKYYSLIRPAIKNTPELIKYIKDGCYLLESEIKEALKSVKITKEDLKNNPSLCSNASLMYILGDEFRLYSRFLSEEEKIEEIMNSIKNNTSLTELPFLDTTFGSKASSSKLDKVLNLLKINIDQEDLDIQNKYYQDLDRIIDGIIIIRYDLSKKNNTYSDIVSINEDIFKHFNSLKGDESDKIVIDNLINKIYEFTGKTMNLIDIEDSIYDYYDIYYKSGNISLTDTSYFGNIVLNYNRNYYISREKQKLLKEITSSFELSSKKKKQLINNKKFRLILSFIRNKNFEKLGVNEEEFNNIVDRSIKLKDDKIIRKTSVELTDDMIEKLKNRYKKNALLEYDEVKRIINSGDRIAITQIMNVFTRINAKFFNKIDDVTLSDKEISMAKSISYLGVDDFVIASKEKFDNNLARLILELSEEEVDSILENKNRITSIKYIIPFANIIKEYDTEILAKILSNYARIEDKISMLYSNNSKDNIFDIIIKKMNIVITLAKGYASIDDIMLHSLGEEIVPKLGESLCEEYFKFYKNMLKRMEGSIPPVNVEFNNKYYKSGDYSNPERLLIGKLYEGSCIDLNNSGEVTFRECLEGLNGDVILVKDDNNKLLSRILMIRRGNVVQLINLIFREKTILPAELYKMIGEQIINQAKEKGDNIDYVVVASSVIQDNNKECRRVEDERFVSAFPHADVEKSVTIVASTNQNEDNFDFNVNPKHRYVKLRKQINYYTNELEITRLRALRIALELDEIKKQELERNFNIYDEKEYVRAISGEDWYIAIRKDGSLEELILPNGDSRAFNEIEYVKSMLQEDLIKGKRL